MIKGEVTVCGTINSSATTKKSHDGNKFVSLGVVVPMQGKDSSVCELQLKVSLPGDETKASKLTAGKHIQFSGHLNVRKVDGNVYYNVRCEEDPKNVAVSEPDSITGSLDFSGCIDKNGITVKKSKTGKDYQLFSAWSKDSHNDSDKAEFVYVKFINFNPSDDLKLAPKTYIDVKGDLEINIWKKGAYLECRVKEIKIHEFPPTLQSGSTNQ